MQALDGTTNPQDAQGRTAEDFVTQVSNLYKFYIFPFSKIQNPYSMVFEILI